MVLVVVIHTKTVYGNNQTEEHIINSWCLDREACCINTLNCIFLSKRLSEACAGGQMHAASQR